MDSNRSRRGLPGCPAPAAATAAALLACAAWWVPAKAWADPAGLPTTVTAETSPHSPDSAPAGPLTKIELIGQALKLSPEQADAYLVDLSRTTQLAEQQSLTMFLRRIKDLPRLVGYEMSELDMPSVAGLLRRPRRYAGEPIRLRLMVVRAWRWVPGEDFRPTMHWTAGDGPVWRYDCLNAEAASPTEQPVCVLSPVEPNAALGQAGRLGGQGEWSYDAVPQVEVAAVFYKVFSVRSESGARREYPVVLAWQIQPAGVSRRVGASSGTAQQLALVVGLVLVIGALFLMRMKQMRKLRSEADDRPAYRRPSAAPRPGRPAGGPPAPEEEVDPALKAAAQDYLQDKQDDHGTSPSGQPR